MGVQYVVQQGDCLNSIAQDFGFSGYEQIYLDPANAAFRQNRPNPNIICPGDVLYIPDLKEQEVQCATEKRHRFILSKEKVYLRLCLQDDLHRPFGNTTFRMRVEAEHFSGKTNSEGMLQKEIPADAVDGEITIFPLSGDAADEGYTFTLKLGHLDPIDEASGVNGRLMNLGFGPPDTAAADWSEDDQVEALKAFQNRFGLPISALADDATRQKLQMLHDGE